MEPDNITIAACLKQSGYTTPSQVSKIMGTSFDHAYSLLQQVEENERLGSELPSYLEPEPTLPFGCPCLNCSGTCDLPIMAKGGDPSSKASGFRLLTAQG